MLMEWVESTLGEICDAGGGVIKTGPFGSQLHQSDYEDEGIPVVMPKDIIDGRVLEGSIARVNDGHIDRLSQHKLSEGDIVYGRRGDIGNENAGWLCGTGCLRVTLGQDTPVSSRFLHLYLKQPDVITWISNQAIGATMPNLNTSILRSVPVKYPNEYTYQDELADNIFAYENLIENNNRRIAILEEMAKSLYYEWFVKFRFPDHENVKSKDSLLGQIPKGWEVKTATEVIEFAPKMSLPKDGEKPFVAMPSISTSSMIIDDIEMRAGNSGTKFINGDTLMARITPCLQNGKTGFVQFLNDENPIGFGSTEFIVMRSNMLTPEFVYCLARSDSFRGNAINSMAGADGRQRVKNDCFKSYYLAVPPENILDQFSSLAVPAFKEIFSLSQKNKNLRKQRDMLLPKLISGSITI
jgi:type I restriction enzyme S subunit